MVKSLFLIVFFVLSVASFSADSVSTNGVKYNVKIFGDKANTAVVLLHGWMGTSHSWRKIAPELGKSRFVIVPDMRGYGGSDKPNGGYDAVNLAKDIKGLVTHYGYTKVHIVGHDMGALVALAFAGTYPEHTHSLTYLDEPLVGFNLDQFTVYRKENYGGYWHFGFNTAPGLPELLIKGKEQEFVDWIVPLMHSANPNAVLANDRAIYAASLKNDNGIAGSVGWYRGTFQTIEQLQAIGKNGLKVPLAAWGGEYGIPITFDQMKLIGGADEGGVVKGAGHLLPEEAPEFLIEKFNQFFNKQEAQQ